MPCSSKVLLAKLLLVHKVIELLHLAHGQSGETWLAFFDSQRGLNFDEEKRDVPDYSQMYYNMRG